MFCGGTGFSSCAGATRNCYFGYYSIRSWSLLYGWRSVGILTSSDSSATSKLCLLVISWLKINLVRPMMFCRSEVFCSDPLVKPRTACTAQAACIDPLQERVVKSLLGVGEPLGVGSPAGVVVSCWNIRDALAPRCRKPLRTVMSAKSRALEERGIKDRKLRLNPTGSIP